MEDFASALIRFDSGLTLQIEASFNLNIKNDTGTIELFGTKSGAKLDPEVELFTHMNGGFVPRQAPAVASAGGTSSSLNNISLMCPQRHACISPAEDGVELMKMIDAIYELG